MYFRYNIEFLEEICTAGLYIKTNCQTAERDCVEQWHTFRPLMNALVSSTEKSSHGYGITLMSSNKNDFAYWTTVEYPLGKKLPPGIKRFILPSGEYLCCTTPTVNALNEAYIAIGEEWLPQQNDYLLNMETPFFEVYKTNWKINDPVYLYVPLKKIS